MNLPHIKGINLARIHDFMNKLLPSIQILECMGKWCEISGHAGMTLNKFERIFDEMKWFRHSLVGGWSSVAELQVSL